MGKYLSLMEVRIDARPEHWIRARAMAQEVAENPKLERSQSGNPVVTEALVLAG
jgi:hypothetical protein